MKLFRDAVNSMAYLKCGIHGFAGSGKSFSASMIAIALHEYIHSKKPIYCIDTEGGSDFLKKYFDKKEIELRIAKTRSFVDLLEGTDEAEQEAEILIIDSITQIWNDLVDAYGKKKGKKRLTLKDWAEIKPTWRQFTDKFLASKLHILMLGRAGWEFDFEEDEEGVKELTKTGTKMKVEVDLGYEPSLSLEMERIRSSAGRIGSGFDYRCWVLKDRSNHINGDFRTFPPVKMDALMLGIENPVFKFILPHIQALSLGGEHSIIEKGSETGDLFNTDKSIAHQLRMRDIALEEIKDAITLLYPGRDAESGKAKLNLLKDTFGTTSWTAIEGMSLDVVLKGKEKVLAIQNPVSEKGGKK